MSVTSRPLPATDTKRHSTNSKAIALAGLIIGCILWPIGARYSIDGLFWLINTILAFLRIPIALITPPHWAFYCLLAPLPYICSRVEWKPPIVKSGDRRQLAAANIVVTWLVIAGYDLATTFLGVRAPLPNGAAITTEIAASAAIAVALSIILTFGPEWLVRSSWRQLMKG